MKLSNGPSPLESPDVLPAGRLAAALAQWRSVGTRGAAHYLWQRFKNLVKRFFYFLYLRRLRAKAHRWTHPRHLGVIMDGNRRYARESGLFDTLQGHHAGAEKVKEVLDWCYQIGIPVVTVWCFSVDNFQRNTREVEGLLRLFEDKTREMADSRQVHEHRVRVRYIGRLEMLPETLRQEIRRIEEITAHYSRLQLNIAMAYGGREEITDAFKRYISEQLARGEKIDDVLQGCTNASIEPYLYTSGQPDPDLILRTSGEVRLSGFLLWQSAHSEFYFCETNWPAFREIDFLRALRSYDERQRRYGR
ncbi:MAG: di-trans,poly-cis-decaprenylcistransferase [bacterium]|nr:di-trans,poly-cis-decaprenylcistransferase [bacterium]